MWIESMKSFEIQCITQGLQIDKAGLSTKVQSKEMISIWNTVMCLASGIVLSTSCAPFGMQWCGLGIPGK